MPQVIVPSALTGLAEVVDVAGGGIAEPMSRLRLVVGRLDRRMPSSSVSVGLARASSKPVRLSPSLPLPFTAMAVGRPSTSKNTSDRLSLMSCISRGASTRKSNCVTRVVLPSASVLDCDEQVARVVFQRGDVAEGIGVALRQIEVLRRIGGKAGDAGADPVLAGQFGRRGSERASVCAAEVAADGGIVKLARDAAVDGCRALSPKTASSRSSVSASL